jgi:hypothetical protein
MSREYVDEPSGAVVSAMEIIKGLSGDNRVFPPDELIRLVHEEERSQDLLELRASPIHHLMRGLLPGRADMGHRGRVSERASSEPRSSICSPLTSPSPQQPTTVWRPGRVDADLGPAVLGPDAQLPGQIGHQHRTRSDRVHGRSR